MQQSADGRVGRLPPPKEAREGHAVLQRIARGGRSGEASERVEALDEVVVERIRERRPGGGDEARPLAPHGLGSLSGLRSSQTLRGVTAAQHGVEELHPERRVVTPSELTCRLLDRKADLTLIAR